MASFTDQQLTPFTPYVAQLPVQAMVQVGMQKQSQYDQGVQKIQTQIDNVAGMDIANGVQKKYLQSKLDELGGKLKTVAAGDFSNQQLVNSVGGMATSIVKDPTIQNAVYSTQKLRQGFQQMKDAQKNGKSSPSNDHIFGLGANSYLNNQDVNATYNGRYEEHVDYEKPLLEAFKDAHVEKMAADENVTYVDKDGKTHINPDILQHKVTEGMSTSRASAIAREVLSRPEFARQVQIDGLYNYKDYDADKLIADKAATLDFKKEQIFQQNPYLRAYATLASGDKKLQANKDLQDNYNTLKSLDADFLGFKTLAATNLEGAKTKAYFDNKINEAIIAHGGVNISTETKLNPQFQANMERSKLVLQQADYNEKVAMDKWQIKNIQSEISHRTNEDMLAQMKLDGKLDGNGVPIWTAMTPGINSEAVSKLGSGSFYDGINKDIKSRNNLFTNITSGIGIDLDGKHYTDLYVKGNGGEWKLNPKYASADGKTLLNDLGSRLYNAAKAQMATKIDAMGELHLNGDADKNYVDQIKQWYDSGTVIEAKRKAAQQLEAQYTPVLNQITKEANLKDNYTLKIHGSGTIAQNILSGKGFSDWQNVNLTKDQLLDVAMYNHGKSKFGDDSDISKQAYLRLRNRFGNDVDKIIEGVLTAPPSETASAYSSVMTQLKKPSTADQLALREGKFKDLQRQSVGQELTFSSKDAVMQDVVRKDLMSELETIMKNKSGGSYATAASMLEKIKGSEGLENNLYKFRYDQNTGEWFARVTNLTKDKFNEGGAEIPVSKGMVNNLHLNKQLDPKEIIFKNSKIGQIFDLNQGYSTAASTTNNINSSEAYVTALERGNVGNYSVGFHVSAKDASNNDYIPYMYIQDKSTGKTYNAVPLDWAKLANLPGLTKDDKLALLNKPGVYDRLQLVTAIDNLKSTLKSLPNPNAAIKLLIGNYDNQ